MSEFRSFLSSVVVKEFVQIFLINVIIIVYLISLIRFNFVVNISKDTLLFDFQRHFLFIIAWRNF